MKCLGNNVVIVREQAAADVNGIVLPDSAKKESRRGQIVCVGPDCELNVGDKVLVPLLTMMRVMQTGAFDLEYRGEPALVVKEEDIAVVWTPNDEGYEEKPRPKIVSGLTRG